MSKRSFESHPKVGVIMGSENDLTVMRHAALTLKKFEIPHEVRVVSAHRTPDRMVGYGKQAVKRGLEVIIAGAGGSAHLPGEIAAHTRLPVLAVAIGSTSLSQECAIGSMIEMPKGVPLAFMGVNEKGAINAGLHAVRELARTDEGYAERYEAYVHEMAEEVEAADELLRTLGVEAFTRHRAAEEEVRNFG